MYKNEIIKILEEANGEYVSGNVIAEKIAKNKNSVYVALQKMAKKGTLVREKRAKEGARTRGPQSIYFYRVS